MDSDSEINENSPKRQKTLRKRKSEAGPSIFNVNFDNLELHSNTIDFESSGEYGDITWHPTRSEDSFSSIIDEKISIAANTSGSRPKSITLCTAITANSAVEENTVIDYNDATSVINSSSNSCSIYEKIRSL